LLWKDLGQMNDISNRITEYLSVGGMWNPESMNHWKVRELLVDCRTEIDRLEMDLCNMECTKSDEVFDSYNDLASANKEIERLQALGRMSAKESDNDKSTNMELWSKLETAKESLQKIADEKRWWTSNQIARKTLMEIDK
jgi:5-methylcytosine-specific restriction endonuclease McrBC regulatory subunit McrC